MKAWIEGDSLMLLAEDMREHRAIAEYIGGTLTGAWVGVDGIGHVAGFRVPKVRVEVDVARAVLPDMGDAGVRNLSPVAEERKDTE